MGKYNKGVYIKCHLCGEKSHAVMEFGENLKYPDDFVLDCPKKCGNNEEGSLPVQNFDILEEY